MKDAPPSGSRWPVFLGLLFIAAVFLVVALSGRRRVSNPASPGPEAAEREARPASAWLPPQAGAAPEEPGNEAPIVDEVRVEHQEVCEGEENLVTVKAHTPAGRTDAFLHTVVGGVVGSSVPVRASLPGPGLAMPSAAPIQVFGKGNVVTTVPMPAYTVKKCHPDRSLFVAARQLPNSIEEQELVATVQERGPSPPLRVTVYRWTFGDGQTEVTAGPVAVHRFGVRNPNALYSDYLVACEAVGGDGRSVVGRTALSLRNLELENLEFHQTLVLSVELTPRFPQIDSRGRVTQTVRLYHHRDVPVKLEQARLAYVEKASRDGQPVEAHAVAELLGVDEVPPGHGIERTFTFDPAAHPGTSMVDYQFEGRTADGVPALASFSVMVPPALPTPEKGTPVADRLLSQKILRAREKLGRAYVNDEDLRQLELAGAFDDLKPAAAPQPEDGSSPTPATPTAGQLEASIAAKGARPPTGTVAQAR